MLERASGLEFPAFLRSRIFLRLACRQVAYSGWASRCRSRVGLQRFDDAVPVELAAPTRVRPRGVGDADLLNTHDLALLDAALPPISC